MAPAVEAANASIAGGVGRLASLLRLERVGENLSGDYTCTVATFTQELSLSQHIQVYGEYVYLISDIMAVGYIMGLL
jgi:hypothetical protein